MQKTVALLFALIGFSFVSTPVSQAQPRLCFTLSEELGYTDLHVHAGDRFNLTSDGSGEPGNITGEVTGSRVNVRLGPGTEYESEGVYGLVGDDITALQWGYDQNCEMWYLVRFPNSGYEGWIKGTYIHFAYPRGLFD